MVKVSTKSRSFRCDNVTASLPILEAWLYIAVWIVFVARVFYAACSASYDYASEISTDLEDGWSFLKKSRDAADSEWILWRSMMSNSFCKWVVGHIILGQMIRLTHFQVLLVAFKQVLLEVVYTMEGFSRSWPVTLTSFISSWFLVSQHKIKLRSFLFSLYSAAAISHIIGVRALITVLTHTAVVCTVAWLTTSVSIVWILSVCCLLLFQFPATYHWMVSSGVLWSEETMLPEYGLVMSLLRSTSCALTLFTGKSSPQHKSESNMCLDDGDVKSTSLSLDSKYCHHDIQSLSYQNCFSSTADVICYVTYLPLFFSGPLMPYSDFHQQFKQPMRPWKLGKIKTVSWLALRVVFWALFLEAATHFVYASALIHYDKLVKVMSLWAVAGVSYMHGQLFMVKYFVIFGGFGMIAMLDEFDPPGPPCCISRVYRYSEMWKTFDRGLYAFMKKHIYIPLGGSRQGAVRRLLATALCFLFVYTWHGLWHHIFYWILMNCCGITIEAITDGVVRRPFWHTFEMSYFSPATSRRLHCIATVPLTAMSCFASFVFFGGTHVGYIIFTRLVFEGYPWSTLMLVIALYCYIQTAKEIERLEARCYSILKSD